MIRHACLIISLFAILTSPARLCGQEQSLYWRDLTVNARLDADGRLHVKERHAMVFTGDWNGGERKFRLDLGQSFDFERISRIDRESGRETALVKGDLSQVDQFKWIDSNTLRWRSRLPETGFFNKTEIVYDIEYTLSHILLQRDGGYLLDHNFGIPGRPGEIQKFTLALDLDPAWKPLKEFEAPTGIGPMAAGEGYVVTLPLSYLGAGKPAAVRFGAAANIRYPILLALVVMLAALLVLFYRREKSLGRFEPLVPTSSIDEAWLEVHVLQYSPELVGTLWDESVGPAEVAAVLARLVAEGRLRSEIRQVKSLFSRRDVLHLKIVSRDVLQDYEQALIESLFFDDTDETDTDRIKQHYKKKGFDPSSKIRKPLEKLMREIVSPAGSKPSWKWTFILTVVGLALLGIACFSNVYEIITGLVGGALIVVCYVPARILAAAWSRRLVKQGAHFIPLIIPLLVMAGVIGWLLVSGALQLNPLVLAGLAVLCIAAFNSALNGAKTEEGPEQIRFRQRLAAAREYFREQLKKAKPALHDVWYPYLIAYGLGNKIDKWFKAHGSGLLASSAVGSVGYSSGMNSSTTWTGGGGAFGGAGATGSWAAVAGTMAAGVATASSGSGRGGGGGRSGGGSAGGW
ncbi:MAG: DUF2207 domain-containing protein [Acidobacteria bacterium]|nr:DUF2207 domain-containing protein [Acidobacteriota bacterium]